MTPQHLFVFDIETIPDTDLAPALTGCDSADILERREAMRQYHLKATDGKNDFLRQPFHKVVAISFAEAQIVRAGAHEAYTLVDIRSGGTETSSEKELVLGFFKYLEKKNARLVSFNGRTFDLPVLKYRALHYGIPTPWLYNTADKWNNYSSRYSLDWHCDLIEAFSDFGASARVKLHEVAVAVGLPGKFGVDGGDVAGMFDDGKIKEIRAYCETDVLNTFLLYLRLQQHRGTLATPDYNDAVTSAISYCESMDAAVHPQFGEFLDAWRLSSKGTMGIL